MIAALFQSFQILGTGKEHCGLFYGTWNYYRKTGFLETVIRSASRIRYLVNFGFKGYDDVGFLGINGKMSEASAAMGLASLPAVDGRADKLHNTYDIYAEHLRTVPGISVMPVGLTGRSNYQYAIIFIDEERYGVSRDMLYAILWKENVIARRYFYPGCHRMEPYKTINPSACGRLPVTEDVSKRILCLPTNLENPDNDISNIARIMKLVHAHAQEVSKWLSDHH